MCANYAPTRADTLATLTSLEAAFAILPEVFPGQHAPLIRLTDHGELQLAASQFGIDPIWNKDPKFSRFTYNARSETAATKPSFRSAWKRRQLGLAPMQAFFEPNYASGKAVRWRIDRNDQQGFFAIALWESKHNPHSEADVSGLISHSLLTVNADHHRLMNQFHAPDDEKRSIITLEFGEALDWLKTYRNCGDTELLNALKAAKGVSPEAYQGNPAPLPPRTKRIDPKENGDEQIKLI